MKSVIISILLLASLFGNGQVKTDRDAELLHRAQQSLTDVIVHDVFSPPAASRIYLYANLAAYEVFSGYDASMPRLKEKLQRYPDMRSVKKADKNVNVSLAAIAAYFNTASHFIFSEQRLRDSAAIILAEFRKTGVSPAEFDRSVALGKVYSDSMIACSSRDRYRETRSMRRYSVNSSEGRWIPTPPAYMAAVEPHWGRVLTCVLDSASQFKPPKPFTYNRDSTGDFYRQALDVYGIVKNLTEEQRDIALFWDCNPFFVNTSGHLMFATKKLSPGGHWMSIAGLAAQERRLDASKSAIAYTYTAIALYDGFISCWDEKYRSNYIRPESFINSHIDESWRPLLQTPPFPEYTSGHSVISNAAASVLTALFGSEFKLRDITEVGYGLPVREFNSFQHAADEAAVSRLYGGIHFREAVVHGAEQGKMIGNFIVGKLDIKRMF